MEKVYEFKKGDQYELDDVIEWPIEINAIFEIGTERNDYSVIRVDNYSNRNLTILRDFKITIKLERDGE